MLYCYKPLDIFWSDQGDLDFTAFHVTPYLNQILKKGKLLPTIHTKKSTLGENQVGQSVRGCLVSFFDDFQTAMNGCYSLAIYALLKKNLLSNEQFATLIKDEWINVYGDEHELDLENGLNLTAFTQITTALYNAKDINTIFEFLNKSLDFSNPHILTEEWVKELPNTVEGVLDNIGVLEVKFSKKYIADPSVYMDYAPSIYSDGESSKARFGHEIYQIEERVRYTLDSMDEEDLDHYYGVRQSEIARAVVQKCNASKMRFTDNEWGDFIYDAENLDFTNLDLYSDLDKEDETVNVDDEITFVREVEVPRNDMAIWNAAESEWRIPAYDGISVNESNVVALAGDIQNAMGGTKLVYQKGTTVRGRKNPQKQPIYVNNLGIHINTPITLYHASVNAENLLKFGYLTKEELLETYKGEAVMGLGGGSGLSMTGDPRYATAIAAYFGMTFRLAIRDITPLEVMEQFALAAPKTVSEWKSKNSIPTDFDLSMSLLELAEQGKWCIRTEGILSDKPKYSSTGDPRLVDSESKFKRTYIVDLDQCTDYNGNPNPYKDVELIINLVNSLTIFASSNEELTYFAPFNSNLYKAFVGKDFSELNNLCVVTSKLKSGTILYPNSDSYFKSIFDYYTTFRTFFVSNLSDFMFRGDSFEEPYKIIKSAFSHPLPPEVKPEVNLEFEIDTDRVEYLTPDLKKKMVGFLPAEDEFRLHRPKEGLTPPKEFACADKIFEHLEQVWGTSEINCFYPWFEIKTLEENLSED